jgi:glutamyl-Q tRNA(Asp) synthetase
MLEKTEYRGRFAPSPTGPLHFGSLVTAVGSYLQARQQQGKWLVRIEDLDPPREVQGATAEILRTLEHYGLGWDGEVVYQSQRSELYLDALERLTRQGLVYPCGCSRKEVMYNSLAGRFGPIYQGICRQGLTKDKQPRALRVLTHDSPIVFTDQLQGRYEQRLEEEIGDFVVRRADKLFAYQLAVVIDDAEQQITEIVRGADLLDNTPRQIHLQQLLEVDTPKYIHLPVAVNAQGQKLSKQTGAKSIHDLRPQQILFQVLLFLNQKPPTEIIECDLESFWKWAITNWQLSNIPRENQPAPFLQF